MSKTPSRTWQQTIIAFAHPRVVTMLFFGISAGLPLLLIFSSLSLWLREAGVERAAVTYFSWAALGYSFKFVWAPLVDSLPIPWLTGYLGRRRAWLLVSQLAIMTAILMMAMIDPSQHALTAMAWAAVMLGFSSATQDVALDAYRIESAESELQALMSSSYIAGYRIGMLLAGAGALFLAAYLGSSSEQYSYVAWRYTYIAMALLMLIGIITTLIVSEPAVNLASQEKTQTRDHLGLLGLFLVSVSGFVAVFSLSIELAAQAKILLTPLVENSHLAGFIVDLCRLIVALLFAFIIARTIVKTQLVQQDMLERTYVAPIKDYFKRYGWALAWLLLALVGLYRISDIVLGVISNVFYQDLGFTKPEIASVVKTFGLIMTIVGGFLGGILVLRFGVIRILFLGAILSATTNLLFMLLAQVGYDMPMLYLVISADNLSAGLASAAFIAFLSSLTNISFTAVQYAIFSSLMTLLPKVLGGYSGTMVEALGYQQFFLLTALMGLPVLLLIYWAGKQFELHQVTIK